jgi:hypothetical protein
VTQQDEGNSSVTHTSVSVDYAALGGGTLFAAAGQPHQPRQPGGDVWVSADGTRVYSAAATPKSCVIMNGPDLAILGYLASATPRQQRRSARRPHLLRRRRPPRRQRHLYVRQHRQGLQQYKLSTTGKQLLPRQMAVSGDGWMIVAITDDNVATFLPIGP